MSVFRLLVLFGVVLVDLFLANRTEEEMSMFLIFVFFQESLVVIVIMLLVIESCCTASYPIRA